MVDPLQSRAQPGNRRYGLGLHFKLVLAGTVTTFVGIAMVSSFLVYRQAALFHGEIVRSSEAIRAGLIERGRLLAESTSANMENAIAGYNFTFVANAARSLKERSDELAYALVTNASDRIVVHTNPALVGKSYSFETATEDRDYRISPSDRNLIEIFHPITVGGSRWGNLILAFDLRPMQTQAAHAMARGQRMMLSASTAAMVAALLVTLFGLTVSIVLSRRLLRPITELADDASLIAEGDFGRPVRVAGSGDEIGFLARQFEHMRQSIETYIDQLVVARQRAEDATQEEQRLRTQIEQHSKLLEIKVQERTAELQNINARLMEYDRMKSEFLSNVSHELRSPLAAIGSAAKIISRYGDENKKTGKKFSSVIMDETDRLGRLINDLLDLAKIEAGRVEWNMERMDNPADLLSHVANTFRPLANERGIELELDAPQRLPAVELDGDRMLQVLTNLCSNAMKFTPEGGRVVIAGRETLYQGMPVIMVTVQDSGPGIPPDELEKVFDRFHQVKQKKDGNKPKGTGLGLAICREVVNYHGGAIWAEAPADGGARMVFCLPLLEAKKQRQTTAGSVTPMQPIT